MILLHGEGFKSTLPSEEAAATHAPSARSLPVRAPPLGGAAVCSFDTRVLEECYANGYSRTRAGERGRARVARAWAASRR